MTIQIIKKPPRERNFLVYDLEWIPGPLKVRIVGVFDERKGYRCYRTVEQFLKEELTHANRGKWFYAHAGGLADVQFVLSHMVDYDRKNPGVYQIDASFSGSSAIIVRIRRNKNVWIFVDSYWLLRDKLKNIGKWIGISKGSAVDNEKDDPEENGISDIEFERRRLIKREWYASVDEYILVDYNKTDCEILYRAISNFQDTLLEMGGQLQMTLASCAMQLFRRKYLTRDVDTFNEINEKARKSYVASRVEVFASDVQNSFYYDINSSFPFAMTQPCPGEFAGQTFRIPTNDKYIYIADCEVEVPDNYITPLPVRMHGRVFFPVGKWRGWMTSIDLDLMQREGGKILKVHEVLLFHPFYDLANYANDLYNKRKASDNEFEKIVFKLLLNSLYGKFAESPFKSKMLLNPKVTPITREEQDFMKMTMVFPGAWLQEQEIPIPHVSVAVSSHITSLARRTLYDFMIQSNDFHYCDTDGFSATEEYATGKNLGDLKLEKKIVNGRFIASKMYALEGFIVNSKGDWEESAYYKGKGFSRLTATRFAKLVEGESIEYERMTRIKENWKKHTWEPREATIDKKIRIKSIYAKDFDCRKDSLPKRFTYPDGSTRPWHIDELNEMLEEK